MKKSYNKYHNYNNNYYYYFEILEEKVPVPVAAAIEEPDVPVFLPFQSPLGSLPCPLSQEAHEGGHTRAWANQNQGH